MADPVPASDREELESIALDVRAHLDWLRDSGVREVPAVPKAPAAQRGAPSAAASQASVASEAPAPAPAPGISLRDAVRKMVGAPDKRAPAPPSAAAPVEARPAAPAPLPSHAPAPAVPTPGPSPVRGEGSEGAAPKDLAQIRAELGDCKRCKLSQKRRNIVFGVGSPTAELVFVGEGPGADEDAQGIPFVGAAGQLLTKMIEAMGFTRDEVYICNVVKCRPPGNRDPEPEEIEACEPFLKAQLAHLKPKAIVTLGKFATMTLLREPNGSITRMRGTWRKYQGIPLMPTFHPSYLLRQKTPDEIHREKKKVWDDLQQVMKLMGKAPPAKKT